jgi:hypothetical protein
VVSLVLLVGLVGVYTYSGGRLVLLVWLLVFLHALIYVRSGGVFRLFT